MLVIFCLAIGEVLATYVTALIFNKTYTELIISLSDPKEVHRELFVTLASLSSLLRFVIVPCGYLWLTDRSSIQNLHPSRRFDAKAAMLVVMVFLSALPIISVLIELNAVVTVPSWMSNVDNYLRTSEARARHLTSIVLDFNGGTNLLITIFVTAVVPGITEEVFFRGILQGQLQRAFTKPQHAILLSAVLFSFFHLQFYGFVPRLVLGILLGYLSFRSGNLWYPIIGHVTNNLFGLLTAFLIDPHILESASTSWLSWILLVPATAITFVLLRYLNTRVWVDANNPNPSTSR